MTPQEREDLATKCELACTDAWAISVKLDVHLIERDALYAVLEQARKTRLGIHYPAE